MPITIAIPFYNAEKYLLDSIKSVFAQSYQDWELILIDDGSKDSSLQIANSIKDPRVRVLSDGKNKKLAGRLNQVTNIAKYDYIARMDADDLIHPERLAIQLKILEENPDYDIVTSGVYSVLNDLSIVGKRGTNYRGVSFEEIITRRKGVTHAALLARKSWYERNKYNEALSIAQDLELWTRTSFKNDLKVISIDTPLYVYREEENVTTNKLLRAYKNERQLIKTYKGTFNKLYFKSLFKSLAVKIIDMFNLKIDLLQKRNKPLTKEDMEDYNYILNSIENVSVPIK